MDGIWPIAPHDQDMKIEGKDMYDEYAKVILENKSIDETLIELNSRYNNALKEAEAEDQIIRIMIPDFDPKKL